MRDAIETKASLSLSMTLFVKDMSMCFLLMPLTSFQVESTRPASVCCLSRARTWTRWDTIDSSYRSSSLMSINETLSVFY